MKSQMSLEFLAGVAIILFIYVVTISTFSNYMQKDVLESESGKQVCYKMAMGIDSAVIGGNNFTLNLTLPNKVENKNYVLFTTPGSSYITVDWNDGLFSCTITTQNITATTINSTNLSKISITNLNGKVYISQI